MDIGNSITGLVDLKLANFMRHSVWSSVSSSVNDKTYASLHHSLFVPIWNRTRRLIIMLR
jgi:hypothetical protein